jgi:hypothetical protein
LLLFDYRQAAQILAVQPQEIERQPLGVLFAQLVAQRLEIGNALTAEHHGFSVDDRLARTQIPPHARDRGELIGPVNPFAGVDSDVAGMDVNLGAVAVPLDLVQPFIAGRRDFA